VTAQRKAWAALACLFLAGALTFYFQPQIDRQALRDAPSFRPVSAESAKPAPQVQTTGTHASHAGPDAIYPDLAKTPGAADPAVTPENIQKTICRHGYTKTVRNVGAAVKRAVFDRYGVAYVPRRYEVDHLISLELGGSNDVDNLWPEPYCPLPRAGDCFGAREKDVVENWLRREVCSGRLSLRDAQVAIVNDWFAVYRGIPARRAP
jgi:hypothetical protein